MTPVLLVAAVALLIAAACAVVLFVHWRILVAIDAALALLRRDHQRTVEELAVLQRRVGVIVCDRRSAYVKRDRFDQAVLRLGVLEQQLRSLAQPRVVERQRVQSQGEPKPGT